MWDGEKRRDVREMGWEVGRRRAYKRLEEGRIENGQNISKE